MTTAFKYAVLGLAALVLAACEAKAPDFDAALQAHLKAIADKDIEAYRKTITSGDDLYLIFPNGEALTTTPEVAAFHKDWFGDPDWVMDPEVIKTSVGSDMAMALIQYAYRDAANMSPRASWLVLVFSLEDGEWRLVHDQNTRIAEQESEAE